MRLTLKALILSPLLLIAGPVAADEVFLLNGDRLTGKIISATGGKLILETDAAGEITIDLAKVKTFSTDAPVQLQLSGKTLVESRVAAGPEGEVQGEIPPGTPAQPLSIKGITAINPPPPAWHGAFAFNALFTTGNSETEQFGFTASASKRWENDRLSLGANYAYGRQTDQNNGVTSTTVDYGAGFAKYDHFFTQKFYGYAGFMIEHDGLAGLTYRTTTGPGVGYQWFESPQLNLSTEAGPSWVHEQFEDSGSRDFMALRLAYSVDWTPVRPLKLYHNLEYLPHVADFSDYLLSINAGARATIWKGLFADFRIEYRYDSTPDPGRKSTDTRYILGAGWTF
jgi:putative salt-induced outer membrane protein YdiY